MTSGVPPTLWERFTNNLQMNKEIMKIEKKKLKEFLPPFLWQSCMLIKLKLKLPLVECLH